MAIDYTTHTLGARGMGEQDSGRYAGETSYRTSPDGRGDGRPSAADERLARALGWFSIGLGLAEVAAPRGLANMIGVPERQILLRTLGVREIASGVGILTGRRRVGWLWSRVAGDAMDLALLAAAFAAPRANRSRAAAATAAVAGVTVLDLLCSQRLSGRAGADAGAVRVRKTITVNRPPSDVYGFWRDVQNLPRFMRHLESVQAMGPRRSHWVARAPAGTTVEWDAEITDDEPHEVIAWRSLDDADVPNSGRVRFRPARGGRATEVTVELEYQPPAGAVGALVAKLFGEEPSQQIQEDLRRFKRIMETGELPRTDGQPAGPAPVRALIGAGRRP
jgi:uncharacterized membrane protein